MDYEKAKNILYPDLDERLTTLEEIEFLGIIHRLEQFNGNRTRTAKSLKIGIRTLQRKIREIEKLFINEQG